MSDTTKVGDNPNHKMPDGKPQDPERDVSEDDAGLAAIEDEVKTGDDALGPVNEDEDQPGLPAQPTKGKQMDENGEFSPAD